MSDTKTKSKTQRDRMPSDELARLSRVETILRPGDPYLWIMTFGWAKVGFYIKHIRPNCILVAHCSHFGSAGKDYGRLAMEGTEANCWRYEGELVEINTAHILETMAYNGTVHRSNLIGVTYDDEL